LRPQNVSRQITGQSYAITGFHSRSVMAPHLTGNNRIKWFVIKIRVHYIIKL